MKLNVQISQAVLFGLIVSSAIFVVIPSAAALQSIPEHYANSLPAGRLIVSDIDRDGIGDYIDARPFEGVRSGLLAMSNGQSTHGSAYENVTLLTGTHRVVISTSMGDITLDLYADAAPLAVTNFIELARIGFYNGLSFHRIVPNFVIQGGDPKGNGTGGESIYGAPFPNEENDFKMTRGVLAMANRGPGTNLSQFFIIQRDDGAYWLQGKHTVFGKVINGMDTVDTIANIPTDSRGAPERPVTFTVNIVYQ